ncbi:PrsW family intramembrane metalloprotease [Amycolatopsis rhizosphaerae]|uniref:PrsW family intramembrane metalloprotease n=1 Tax=Amycolatopsis rhizosphaerae TaxID=2053003 RepID=A0A558BQ56_9PSEU|nr:PrsW family glutamic-type intramembrane protease [Amycolatopsis rhizosphaerae]TVT38647.1 PrsW family intramembrane metalloprotease [Amycolatopsis rhizosphaerae]
MILAPQADQPHLPRPGSQDNRMRAVLFIAIALSAVYAVQIIVDVCRPTYPEEPAHAWVGWLNPWLQAPGLVGPEPTILWYQVSFWCYLISLPAALTIWLFGRTTWEPWKWQGLAAAALVLPYPIWSLDNFFGHFGLILLCLPSSAYALWLVHRMQRYGRLPVWLLVSVASGGLFVGGGFGGSMQQWWQDYGSNFSAAASMAGMASMNEQTSVQDMVLKLAKFKLEITAGGVLVAGVFEEVGKAVVVAVVYLLLRRYVHNVVSGIVLGAAAGIGFNLGEAAAYMAKSHGATQYFMRQSLGLLAAHMAFTAAIGAGFGIARQLRDRRSRRLAIVSGFAVGIGGHFANDVFLTTWSQHEVDWFSPSPTVHTLVLAPLTFLLFQGPLVLLYLVLLRRGLRDQAAGLAVELADEAETGFGALTPEEVAVLLRPWRRFYLRLKALQVAGPAGYLWLGRLYEAQLQLGLARWNRDRGAQDRFDPDVRVLRDRVVRLKKQQFPSAQPLQVVS